MIWRRLSRNSLLLLVTGFLCAFPQVVLGSPKTLTILVTGNNFDPARLCTVTDSLGRLDRPLVVVHDAMMQWDSVARARTYTKLMQDAGVDVLIPSVFDLREGPDALFQAYRRLLKPVCANLRDSRDNLMFPTYVVVQKRGQRIGVTSVMTDWGPSSLRRKGWEFSVSDPQESVRSVASQLRKKVDILIVYAPAWASPSLENIPDVDLVVTPRLWRASEDSEQESHSSRQGRLYRIDLQLKGGHHAPVVGTIYLDDVTRDSSIVEKMRNLHQEPAADLGYELESIDYMDFRCPESRRVKHLRGRPVDEHGLLRGGIVADQEVVMKDHDVVSMNPPEPPGKCLSAGLRRGSEAVSLDWSFVSSDTLPRSPYDLYWRPPHLLNARISPWEDLPSGWNGALTPNSDLEHHVLDNVRGVANQFFSWDEQDSLARLCDLTKPEPVLRQRMAGLSTLEQHVAHLLGLVRFLELQDASGLTEKPSYWHRRGVIYANLECNATGAIVAATLLENNAWPSAADSVLQLISTWPIPSQGHETHPDLTWNQSVAFAMDRHETRLRLGDSIPADLGRMMGENSLSIWFKSLVAADSSITLADFVDTGPETLLMQSSKGLDAKEARLRERFGVLRSAPGDRWKVDALPGGTLTAQGAMTLGGTRGLRVLRREKAEDEPLGWESPDQDIDLAVWLDASRLAVAGWSTVDHPRVSGKFVQFWVPTLWMLDLETRTARQLQGPPLSPQAFQKAWQARRAVLEAAYPQLTWAH